MYSFECSDSHLAPGPDLKTGSTVTFSSDLPPFTGDSKNYFSHLSQSCRLTGQNISTYIGESLSMGLQNHVVHPIK